MRVATPDTRRALAAAIGDGTRTAWARRNGVNLIDVSDCLRERPMSARRENRIRAALGLSPIRYELVEMAENQYIVTRTPPRTNKRRAATMTPELAEYADRIARENGYKSWGAMQVAELTRGIQLDLVYGRYTSRNGDGGISEQE